MGRQPCCTRKGCAMELSIPASPSRLAGLRRAARVYLRGVAEEVADDVVLALDEAATNAVLYGSSGDQPIQVVVQVNDDWVEASVGGACGCWAGWWLWCCLRVSGFALGPRYDGRSGPRGDSPAICGVPPRL